MALTPPMPPAAPKMRTLPLHTHDQRDAQFMERASSRPAPHAAHRLLWAPWNDFIEEVRTPAAPGLRCIPLPELWDCMYLFPTTSKTGRRANTFYHAMPSLHSSLQRGVSYDLSRCPSTAVVFPQTPSTLETVLEPSKTPTTAIPFPFSEPAMRPSQSHIRVQAGTHHDILIVAGHSGVVTCGDVLSQLYEYLQEPLRAWEDCELDTRRLLEAHSERPSVKGNQDIVRNIDALLGSTQFWKMTRANCSGTRWVLHTTKPGA